MRTGNPCVDLSGLVYFRQWQALRDLEDIQARPSLLVRLDIDALLMTDFGNDGFEAWAFARGFDFEITGRIGGTAR